LASSGARCSRTVSDISSVSSIGTSRGDSPSSADGRHRPLRPRSACSMTSATPPHAARRSILCGATAGATLVEQAPGAPAERPRPNCDRSVTRRRALRRA
jgi:hypothetical protein